MPALASIGRKSAALCANFNEIASAEEVDRKDGGRRCVFSSYGSTINNLDSRAAKKMGSSGQVS
jgi:hypothetical protein